MAQEHHHHEWPQEVELLLDRQRPQVPQRGECLRCGVSLTDGNLIPVAAVEDSAQKITPGTSLRPRVEQCEVQREQAHHHEQGR